MGGRDLMKDSVCERISLWEYDSPIGRITLASDGESLIGLWIEGQKYELGHLEKELKKEGLTVADIPRRDLPVFKETCRWLDLYFQGKDPGFTPKLNPGGSAFRRLIGEIMLEIPFGQLMTYGEIAKEAARRMKKETMSSQAVGGAVGHNPISIMIPCHRVVGTNGSLTGYAGGVDKKVFLLKNEGIDLEERGLFVPKENDRLSDEK